MFISKNGRRRIVAEDEINVAPEASELLFEAEDVAELVAEVTGEPVEVSADEDVVVFAVGEGENAEEFTVTAEGDEEEVLESSRAAFRGKKPVKASTRRPARRPVTASRKAVRKVPTRRK